MPIPNHVLRALKSTLADLYPDGASAGRVAHDAGINADRLNLRQSPVNAWDEVVEEAVKRDKVIALVEVARAEYKEDSPLARMLEVLYHDLLLWKRRENVAAHIQPPVSEMPNRYDDDAERERSRGKPLDQRVYELEVQFHYYKQNIDNQFKASREHMDQQFENLEQLIRRGSGDHVPELRDPRMWAYVVAGAILGGLVFMAALAMATGGV